MSESGPQESDWIRAWIEQQREHLRRMGEAAEKGADDAATSWFDVGQAYLRALGELAQGGRPPADEAKPHAMDDLFGAWREALASGADPTAREAARRLAEALERIPPLGIAREHLEAGRELELARRECRALERALRLDFIRVQQEALDLLERQVRERERSNQRVSAWRELYDLWVDCGERAYAQLAHSEAYGKLNADYANATVRLRARQQKLIEHGLRQFDLPTRAELNSVHRLLRELRARVDAIEARLASEPERSS
jgi:class III poly(R)-hydroxyalkanoic acid synthase PhaE subunit